MGALLAIECTGETGLERFRLAQRALPGLDLAEVSLRTRLLGAELAAPVLLVGGDCARTATEHGLGLVANELAPERSRLWLASVIAAVVERLAPLPAVARGAGYGIEAADARELAAAGVAAIDVGGACRPGWGVPTADAVAEAVLGAPAVPVLAEVVDALDGAKCLALGATALSFAGEAVETLLDELRLAVWAVGERSPVDLTPGHLRGPLM